MGRGGLGEGGGQQGGDGGHGRARHRRHAELGGHQLLHHDHVVGDVPDPRLEPLARANGSSSSEELFDADLNLIGRSDNHVGDVSGFAPPEDIHGVHNTADTTAIPIHVYGTDVTRIGSGVRRYCD
jgi:hypothetical protein